MDYLIQLLTAIRFSWLRKQPNAHRVSFFSGQCQVRQLLMNARQTGRARRKFTQRV